MKMAKIFAIMFALVLAVFCLNGPFVFGGDSHPWDEEGGGGGGGELENPDPDVPDTDVPPRVNSVTAVPEAQPDGSIILDFLRISLITSMVM